MSKTSKDHQEISIEEKVIDLIGEGQTEEALDYLKSVTETNQALEAQVAMISARFEKLKGDIRTGIIFQENAGIEQNRINKATIELAAKIEKGEVPITSKFNFIPFLIGGLIILAGITYLLMPSLKEGKTIDSSPVTFFGKVLNNENQGVPDLQLEIDYGGTDLINTETDRRGNFRTEIPKEAGSELEISIIKDGKIINEQRTTLSSKKNEIYLD